MKDNLSFGSAGTMTRGAQSSVRRQPQDGKDTSQATHVGVGILLVDDNDDVRRAVKDMLEDVGFRVFSAENGSKAISLFLDKRDSIDLLVSDVVMPMMNGKEVYEQLNRIRPGLPAVFISGYPSDILKQLHAVENVRLLAKPLRQINLVKTIQDVLQS